MPESLSIAGLVAALRDFISNIESTGKIHIDLQVYGDVIFSKDARMMVFRILQELIHNALKHSKADQIEVILIKKQDSCKITVSDNGIGFIYSGLENKSGLFNVEQRVAYLEGEMEVDTKENQGCYVFISIPL